MRHLRLFTGFFALKLTTVMHAAVGGSFASGNFTYKILTEDAANSVGTVSVKAKDVNISGVISIPGTVAYSGFKYTVTTMAASGFANCTKITSISIPSTCQDWSATKIFQNCSGISSVTVPQGVTSLGTYAFHGCSKLSTVSLPDGLTSIGANAFYSTNLKQFRIPSSLVSIGTNCFYGCSSLTSVYITDLSAYCRISFAAATSNPLYAASGLSTNNLALYLNDEKIENLVIPADITAINNYAFYNAQSLTGVTFHENIQSVGTGAFDGCKNLVGVNYLSDIAGWCGITFNSNPLSLAHHLYFNNVEVTEVVIPDNITEIGNNTFIGGSCITDVILPETLTKIGNYAFENTGVAAIEIPNSVTNIGFGAFRDCVNLTDFTIPSGVQTIKSYTFAGCSSLTSLTIPTTVTTLENYILSSKCTSLTEVTIYETLTTVNNNAFNTIGSTTKPIRINAPENYNFGVETTGTYFKWKGGYFYIKQEVDPFDIGGLTYTVREQGEVSVRATAKTLSGDIVIPSQVQSEGKTFTVTRIEEKGFANTKITSVTLPETLQRIDDYAFEGCTGITTFNIPQAVTMIGAYPWRNCVNIESFVVSENNSYYSSKESNVLFEKSSGKILQGFYCSTIPTDATYIIPYAFYHPATTDRMMEQLVIPQSVEKIGHMAFTGFKVRNLVFAEGSNPSFPDDSVDGTNRYTFSGCPLQTVVLPAGFTEITDYMFQNCRSLMDIQLPGTISSIGKNAFENCTSLREINIPDNVSALRAECFSGCTSLEDITWGTGLQILEDGVFKNCPFIQLVLPAGVRTVSSIVQNDHAGTRKLRVLKLPNSVTDMPADGLLCGQLSFNHVTLPTFVKSITSEFLEGGSGSIYAGCRIRELTLPADITTLDPLTWTYAGSQEADGDKLESLFIMGEEIPSSLEYSVWYKGQGRTDGYFFNYHPRTVNIYVKTSVFNAKYGSGTWSNYHVSNKIPVTMTNASDSPIKYKTLCRDFDVDLTHTNDNLPEGVEPLRAYLVDDVEGELRLVFLNEIKYIPSRLKANKTDEHGHPYQGVDEYVGVILRGTPGYTYYYEMGEHDYTQGAWGQWLMEDAMAYFGSSLTNNMMAGDANDDFYVYMTVEDENNQEIVNYGLNNNRFKIYNKDGWLEYNKSYLQLPKSVSDAIERHSSPDGFANLTMVFENADGTTDKVSAVEFVQNAESDIFYNPYGQRVSSDAKGVVISNGKKKINR